MSTVLATLLNSRHAIESSSLQQRMAHLSGEQKKGIDHFFNDMQVFNNIAHGLFLAFIARSCVTDCLTGNAWSHIINNLFIQSGLSLTLIGMGTGFLEKMWWLQCNHIIDEKLADIVTKPAQKIAVTKCVVGAVLMFMGIPIIDR